MPTLNSHKVLIMGGGIVVTDILQVSQKSEAHFFICSLAVKDSVCVL